MTRLAWELAEAGDSVTLLAASHPTLPRKDRQGRLEIVRVGPPRLMFPIVWVLALTSLHGRFDVVVEESMGGERAPFLCRFLSGSPTVGFWYQDNRRLISLMYGGVASVIAGWFQDLLLRAGRVGFAIGNSRSTADWLIAHGFSRQRVVVSCPFIAPSGTPDVNRPFSERRNMIVTIGNFRPTKRFEEAVAVFQKVHQEVPGAELALLGREQDAEYLTKLRQVVSKSGVGTAVRFYVGASDPEKFEILSRAKVLTIHSPIEGFGWTILEAGLCGVPTVGNAGISADALRDGTNGRRLNFGDVDAYVSAVARLLNDGLYWDRLSRGARSVASEYSSGVLNQQVRDLLALCAASRHGERQGPAS